MNSRQKSLSDTKILMKHLQHRRNAVRCAAGIRNDQVLLSRTVRAGVNAIDKGGRIRGCRDQDSLCLSIGDVFYSLVRLCEFACTFEYIVDAQGIPFKLLQVALRGQGNGAAVYDDEVFGFYLNRCSIVEVSHGGVISNEVDEVFDCDACVVDGDDLDV